MECGAAFAYERPPRARLRIYCPDHATPSAAARRSDRRHGRRGRSRINDFNDFLGEVISSPPPELESASASLRELLVARGEARDCCLYRHFDDRDILLYVGISQTPTTRLEQHRNTSRWAFWLSRVELEWFKDRGSARRAELAAIAAERPVFNREGVKGKSLDRELAYMASRLKPPRRGRQAPHPEQLSLPDA